MEKTKARASKSADENGGEVRSYVMGIVKGCLVGILSSAIFILIFAIISANLPISGMFSFQFGVASYLLSAAMAGIFAAKFSGSPFISGAIAGGIFAVFILLISSLMPWESEVASTLRWGIRLCAVPVGAIMAVICGRNREKGKKRRKRKR